MALLLAATCKVTAEMTVNALETSSSIDTHHAE